MTAAASSSQPIQNNPLEQLGISPQDIHFKGPKKAKHDAIKVVAQTALFKGCKVTVTQAKDGSSKLKLNGKAKSELKKAKKEGDEKTAQAVIDHLQKTCLSKIAEFKKEHEGKKIDKPVAAKVHHHKKHHHHKKNH
jgi:hypothetical protein